MSRVGITVFALGLMASTLRAQWNQNGTPSGAIYYNGGNVGIGTTSTTAPLSFGAAFGSKIDFYPFSSSLYGLGLFTPGGYTLTAMYSNAGYSSSGASLGAYDGTTYTSIVTARPNGRVGINLMEPISSLHQYSNSPANPTTAALTGSSWDGLLTLNSGAMGVAGGGGGIVFGGNWPSQYFAAVKALLTNGSGNTAGDLAFSTRNSAADIALTERLRLTADGKLGLGVAAPVSSLQQYSNTGNNPTTAALTGSALDGLLTLNAGALGVAGGGGGIAFGGNGPNQYFAAVKALLTNGSGNTAGDLAFSTRVSASDAALTERMRITAAGGVGIGTDTPTPASMLTVSHPTDARLDVVGRGSGFATVRLVSNNAGYASIDSMDASYLTAKNLVLQPNGGQMIVGPLVAGHTAEKLVVAGDAYVTGTVSAGNVRAQYQDVAEWVPATADLPAGTVVVVRDDARNTVAASVSAYDTRVAGVVSAQPGIILGTEDSSKAKVATTGRVKVRVDATRAPIHAGDLLVTSDLPGVAMRSEPVDVAGIKMHRPGTLIGKALEPLSGGQGEILVLLSLQ